ncbi:transient receptor potential cation channel subfamily A member 1 homolog isoform X2 [Mercenaria mercenaria]|uniref:transient receptor potential cation channel subfamily A member 1 homolog isoform X2 n=1 Tax=Mercenaria mercenaria TaxID=6596 RepID=UPI00234EF7DE|nr:transient receptor potential cation channel subfamily A member 1 homolog isoform X2 [Mercenaria mercenaria]XP_053403552.1 transient receptor potential cation channel subfamily A member 1 homolog isoform X2 [Mercenaria mercenaria]XP_053403553.1 transient receptor potential cation channel subfamily A member 1 homolog isoform X2 [Mercenaria mercenaria]XP_053403554.1 transient receptor potential cation channel subfamily A member 1 homolog isoform X2 [Mercenaria mercenaria]XP_053403555.1 transien
MANETDPMIGVGSETENSHEMHTIGQNGTERIEERQAANDTNYILECVKKSPINIDRLKEFIESGEDVNSCDKDDERTALHEAALKGEEEAVDVLLQAGAHIKYRDTHGNTALHFAVQSGSEKACDVFKRLLPTKEKLEKICGTGPVHETTKRGKHYTQTRSEYWIDTAVSVNEEGFNVLDLALEKITAATNNKINEERRNIVRYIVRETGLYCLLRLLRNNTRKTFSTPFRELIEKMPEVALEVMNKCITKKRSEVTFHYEFLDDTYFLKEWPPKHDDYPSTWEHRLLKDTEKLEAYTNNMKKMKTNHPLWLMVLHLF